MAIKEVDLGNVIGPQGPKGSSGAGSNLLDNWYFVNPINRNGKTNYTKAEYTIDRWRTWGTVQVKLGEDGIELSNSGPTNGLFQYFEASKTTDSPCVFSILTSDNILYSVVSQTWSSNIIRTDTPFGYISITRPKGSTGNVAIRIGQGNSVNVVAAKLELGDTQTLAHQNAFGNWVLNEIPNYADQYAICSMYDAISDVFIGLRLSNPNLLDNWYFADPINQRGKNTYLNQSENYTYFIDRWIYGKGVNSINLSSDGVTIDSGDTTYTFIMQRINPTVLDSIKGKTVTMSILVKGNGTVNIGTVNNEQGKLTVNGNDYQLLSCTFVFNNSGNYSTLINCPNIGVAYDAGGADVVTVLAAKLELGDTQTLAHQNASGNWVLNDPPPDYGTELSKCQRYYMRFYGGYSCVMYGAANGSVLSRLFIQTPVTMRKTPSAKLNGTFLIGKETNTISQSSFDVYLAQNGILLSLYGNEPELGASYEVGTVVQVIPISDVDIAFDSEL